MGDTVAADGGCTLREAITNANADNQTGSVDCATGAGADTISIPTAGTINLLSALPSLTTDITINGSGANVTIVRRDSAAATEFRIFFIQSSIVTISGMTVRDGIIRGADGVNGSSGNGGGIYNSFGTMTITNVIVTNNQVIGGNGTGIDPGGFGGGSNGGGVYNRGAATVTSSSISGNSATAGNGANYGGQSGGGGFYNGYSDPVTITNSVVSGNTATSGTDTAGNRQNSFGGGIGNAGNEGNMTLNASAVINNSAVLGAGGIYNGSSTVLSVNNSVIIGNTGNIGGIINTGTMNITDSTVSGNAGVGSGAIFNQSNVLNLLRSTVSGNTASWDTFAAGGIVAFGGTVNVTNSTVSDNASTGTGGFAVSGGIVIANGATINLTNDTITNNSVANPNAFSGVFQDTGTVNVKNTIIAAGVNNATVPDVGGTNEFVSQGYNLIGNVGAGATFSQATDQTGMPGAPLNPRLAPLAGNGGATETHKLLAGSPAIDKASATAGITTDQRGFGRPVDDPTIANAAGGDGSDIGAFEADRYLTVNTAANTFDTICNAADCSLRDAVSVAGADALPDTIIFNIPANSAGCSGTACTITSQLAPAADAGNLTTIDGGAASANTITLNGGTNRILFVSGAKVSVNNLIFTGGGSSSGSAVLIKSNGTLTLTNSALFNNINTNSIVGGGAVNIQSNSTLTMTNVTVSGNSATNDGGGIESNGGTVTATNCTITNNTVTDSTGLGGGGVYNGGTFNVRNTIIAGNSSASTTPDAGGLTFNSQGNNLIGNGSGSTGFTNGANGDQVGTTVAPIDARLSPLGNYGGKTLTHALLDVAIAPNMTVSPAINAGTVTSVPTTDQRGAVRFGNTDIGAFEVDSGYRARLPDGKLFTAYDQTIAPESGSFVYTLTSGTTPTGTTLNTDSPTLSPEAIKPDYQNIAPAAGRVSIQGTPTLSGTYPFSITPANLVNSATINYSIFVPAAPSAANVSISGRVLTPDGRGLSNAKVILTDAYGTSRMALTGAFGYYTFEDIRAAQTVIISIASKRYQFAPQAVNANESLSEVNFTAQP